MSGSTPLQPAAALIEDLYPLSPMQQGMLLQSLLQPASGLYLQQLVCTLSGPLDRSAFGDAWQALIQRHPILRTTFVWEDLDTPLQAVYAQARVPIHDADWRELPAEAQQERLAAFLADDRRRGFAGDELPLLRLALFRCAPEQTRLVVSYHHALLDGWSLAQLLEELQRLYLGLLAGAPPSLPYRRPYRDYIAWLQRQDLAEAEQVWRATLAGAAPSPLLDPADLPETPADDYAELRHTLDPQLTQNLAQTARQASLTLNTLVLGAWLLLLSRVNGAEQVMTGTIASGRPADLADADRMIGLFTHVVPLAARVPLAQPAQTWLHELQVLQARLRAFEYVSLAQIQSWSPLPATTPLFEHVVVFENYPAPHLAPTPTAAAITAVQVLERTHFPLALAVLPGDQLTFQASYQTRRYTPATIQRLLGQLATILAGFAADLSRPLRAVPLLPPAERDLLRAWNTTAAPYPRDRSIPELFQTQAAATPEALAVIGEDEQLTFAALAARADVLAQRLLAAGLRPEGRVAVYLQRSPRVLVALLAILQAGGVYAPLDLVHPSAYSAAVVAQLRPQVLLTETALAERLPALELTPATAVLDVDAPAAHGAGLPLPPPPHREQLACIMYTTGSTGTPKGVGLTHHQLLRRLGWMWRAYPFAQDEVACQRTNLSFSVTLWELLGAPLQGRPTVIVPDALANDPEGLVGLLAAQRVSRLTLVPSFLRHLLAAGLPLAQELAALRVCSVLGEPLPPELAVEFRRQLPHAALLNQYGASELLDISCYDTRALEEGAPRVPIGRPVDNVELYVLDEQLEPVGVGVVGELYVASAALARGYLDQPALTAERFVPNPFADGRPTTNDEAGSADQGRTTKDEIGADSSAPLLNSQFSILNSSRLYRMGDRGRYRADGTLECLGRQDQQVKLHGVRVELGAVEAVLAQHPQVRAAVAQVYEGQAGQARLAAYVVPAGAEGGRTEQDLKAELRAFLYGRLPETMVPTDIVLLPALPLTANGKIDRRALPPPGSVEPGRSGQIDTPRTPLEARLAQIWSEVLGGVACGIHQTFFELGGDSLLVLRVVSRAKQDGISLSAQQIMQHQTIAALAEALSGAAQSSGERASETAPEPAGGTGPLSDPVVGPVPIMPRVVRFFADNVDLHNYRYNTVILLEVKRPLELTLVRQIVRQLLLHHDSLRLRYTLADGQWRQSIAPPDEEVPVAYADLSTLPQEAQRPAIEQAVTRFRESLNICEGPLLRVVLFELGHGQPQQLLVIVHHLATDQFSTPILLEDMQTLYTQLCCGLPVHLPAKTASVKRWAELLMDYAQSAACRGELAYWQSLPWQAVGRLPVDEPGGRGTDTTATTELVEASLSAEETYALLHAPADSHRGQALELLLAALGATLAEWTGEHTLLLEVIHHGRGVLFHDIDLSRTVGWLSAHTPVLLQLEADSELAGILKSVQEQYQAIPNAGIGYELITTGSAGPELQRQLQELPRADILLNYLGQMRQPWDEHSPFRPVGGPLEAGIDGDTPRYKLLELRAAVFNDRLEVQWNYSSKLYRRATVERLAERLMGNLRRLIGTAETQPGQPPTGEPLELTEGQAWLFGQEQIDPRRHPVNVEIMLDVPPGLDSALLEQTVAALVRRHDALRSRFVCEDGRWRALIAPPDGRAPFARIDLSDVPDDQLAAAITQAATALQRGFDIESGPLLCFAHIVCGPDRPGRLLLAEHHLITDLYSMWILLDELQTGYRQLRQGQPIRLPPQTAPLRLWVERVHAYARAAERRAELAAWLQRPWDAVPPLPLDYPEGRARSTARAQRDLDLRLDRDETLALQAFLASQDNASMADALLAALLLTLTSWGDLPRIGAVVMASGRNGQPGVEDLDVSGTVGWLSHSQLLVLERPDSPGPAAALRATREQLRRTPTLRYDLLRYLSGDPLIERQLRGISKYELFFNYTGAAPSIRGSIFLRQSSEQASMTDNFDDPTAYVLACRMGLSGGALVGRWIYSEAMHRRETIEALARQFLDVLRALASEPHSEQVGAGGPAAHLLADESYP